MTSTDDPDVPQRPPLYPLSTRTATESLRIPAAVLIVLLIAAHAQRWGLDSIVELLREPLPIISLLAAYFAGLFVHELLHTLGYTLIGRAPIRSCPISFDGLLVAARCLAPIRIWRYRAATALPGLVLGLLPLLTGLLAGKAWMSVYGAIMTGGALGDMRVLWVLRSVPGNDTVIYRPAIGAYEAEPSPTPAVEPAPES
ncbi:MAG: metalloprotease family protein [Acidobacteriota bacterium]